MADLNAPNIRLTYLGSKILYGQHKKGELGFKPIIQNHKSFAADEMRNRNFEDHVLAYVTPWNNHGYVRDQTQP